MATTIESRCFLSFEMEINDCVCIEFEKCKDHDRFIFFVYIVEARMRANTHRTARGHETRGAGEGRTKQWGTETLGDLWKGEGCSGEQGVYD